MQRLATNMSPKCKIFNLPNWQMKMFGIILVHCIVEEIYEYKPNRDYVK